jgi:hypothetical protein
MKITQEEYNKFLEHLAWQRLQSPDYRLGQAFLNYFPRISKALIEGEHWGTLYEYNLFNEINDLKAQKIIDFWIDQ